MTVSHFMRHRVMFTLDVRCVPGLEAAGDDLSLASMLCSRCLNTSLGLNDL